MMWVRHILFLTGLGFLSLLAQGQQPPVSVPAGHMAAVGNPGQTNGSVDVELFTGMLKVDIPVGSASGKDLTIPVSLNYIAGKGVRLQDYASEVGLGWQLVAGGSISRVVRGLPDDLNNLGYLGSYGGSQNGWADELFNWGTYNTPLPADIDPGIGYPTADGEPDLFTISTPFFSAQFVFDKDRKAIFSNASGLSVIPHIFYGSVHSPEGYGFTVIDEYGNKYLFGGTSAYHNETTTKLLGGTTRTFKSTWFLNRIITYNNREVITFTYQTSPSNVVRQHYRSSRLKLDSGWQPRKNDSTTTTVHSPKLISRIQTSISEINFSYLFDRLDIPNAGRLNTIQVRARTGASTTKLLNTYQFNTTYFGAPSSDRNRLRLRLDNVKLIGGDDTPAGGLPYKTFRYFNTYSLPSRKSDHFDYWGYHNYMADVADPLLNTALRAPNTARNKANILIGIDDLGGLRTNINYELNDYYSPSANSHFVGGGLRVESISLSDPGGQTMTTSYVYENEATWQSFGRASTDSWSNLTVEASGGSTSLLLNFSESLSNVYDINGTFIGYLFVKTKLPTGGYIETTFNTFDDFPDLVTNWSYTGGTGSTIPPNVLGITSSAYKRGYPTSKITYNQSGAEISYEYYDYQTFGGARSKNSFGFQLFPVAFQWPGNNIIKWISYNYWTWKENYNLQRVTRVDVAPSESYNSISTTTQYTYSPNAYFLVRTALSVDSKGNIKTKTNYYSADPVTLLPGASNQDDYDANLTLRQTNVLAAPYSEEVSINGKTEKTENTYRRVTGTSPLKVRLTSSENRLGNTLVDKINYTYDGNDNQVTSQQQFGIPTTTIYGYNHTYPIAEIQNATYATVVAALGGQTNVNNFAANYAPTPAAVAAFLAPLRTATTLSSALVTTSIYEPGVGLIRKTDPLGKTTSYEYDDLLRLLRIRDNSGYIVEEYKYNYRTDD
ncbi:hypothetical protein ACFOET_11800 [Parapedobacter deserti]|uniref:YD repeat-containing protein n=1 Tax=Parapedobacter deserti TaxID=1912957 RepID=A0ABV7JSP0_9SPHI